MSRRRIHIQRFGAVVVFEDEGFASVEEVAQRLLEQRDEARREVAELKRKIRIRQALDARRQFGASR